MNVQKYRDWILEKYVTPFMHAHPDIVFQQDNSSVHCSKLVSNYLDSVNILPLQWPSKSPDLNIIENLWHVLKELVGPVNHINADHILWYAVKNAWAELKTSEKYKDYIPILYSSMLNRCRAVIEKQGGCIKY